jgi:hypothetical protein
MEKWLAEMKLRARRKIGEISLSLDKITPVEKGEMAHSVVPATRKNSI